MMSIKIWKSIIQQKKVLIVFDDMIADMEANENLSPIVTELFFKGQKTQHFTCFYIKILFRST